MARFTSPTDLAGFSDQDLRDSWRARGLLLRNLFTALRLRGQLATILLRRAASEGGGTAPHAWMEALHATWVLTENLLAAFELLANPDDFDARTDARRKAAWSRLRDRDAKKRGKFVKKTWGYPVINTPALDDLYLSRGLTVDRGRAAALSLAARSAAYLESVLGQLQAFHRHYEDPCTAFKHGRAIFSLAVSVQRGVSGEVTGLNLKRDEGALTSIVLEQSQARLAELRIDDELKEEVESTLTSVRSLVERQANRCAEMVALMEAFISNRGGDAGTALGLVTALFVFVEPETDDERQLYGPQGGGGTPPPLEGP